MISSWSNATGRSTLVADFVSLNEGFDELVSVYGLTDILKPPTAVSVVLVCNKDSIS